MQQLEPQDQKWLRNPFIMVFLLLASGGPIHLHAEEQQVYKLITVN